MQYKYAEIGDIVYFWFAANATTGAAGDGASPLFDVRLAGAAANAAPTASGTPTLLSHADYTDGLFEIAIDTGGYSAGEYAVFCTLTISTVNPAGFCGSFRLSAAGASLNSAMGLLAHADYGLAKLVRSTTPANTLSVDVSHLVAVPSTQKIDVETIKTRAITCGAGVTVNAYVGTAAQDTAQTGDNYVRLGAPAGASVSADVAAVKAETASILEDTGTTLDDLIDTEVATIISELAKVPKSDSNVSWNATALAAINAEMDTALNTAIPGSPAADSINERIATMDTTAIPAIKTVVDTIQADTDLLDDVSGGLADIHTDIAAVKTDTAAILVDTGTDGVVVAAASKSGYALSAAGVQSIWDVLTSALTTANSIGKKLADWVVGTIDTYTGNTKQTGDSYAAITTTTIEEMSQGKPPVSPTMIQLLNYLYREFRNKNETTATTKKVYDDAGTTVLFKETHSDNATTFTKGEFDSGA
jgi:hypothetical protein